MKKKIRKLNCSLSILQEAIKILERIYDETKPRGAGSFVYYLRENINSEERLSNLLSAFMWLVKQGAIEKVKCYQIDVAEAGIGTPRGWLSLNDKFLAEMFYYFAPDTLRYLTQITGTLKIKRKKLFEMLESWKEIGKGEEGISESGEEEKAKVKFEYRRENKKAEIVCNGKVIHPFMEGLGPQIIFEKLYTKEGNWVARNELGRKGDKVPTIITKSLKPLLEKLNKKHGLPWAIESNGKKRGELQYRLIRNPNL